MPLRCPKCREPLDSTNLTCHCGHQVAMVEGVLVLLEPQFAEQLQAFLTTVARFRADEGKRLLDPAIYPQLPFAGAAGGNVEWQLRCYDLMVVLRLLGQRKAQRVLDIGAWNGWLSYQLARRGHQVTALDYFVDPCDGLRARQFYPADWLAIQMDLNDLSLLDEQYDLVILNRCVQFFGDPADYMAHVLERVAPGGSLIATGLTFWRDPRRRVRELAELQGRYLARYGSELFLRPTRGYLDAGDHGRFKAMGLKVRPYAQLWRGNLKALFKPTLPWQGYGVRHAA